MTRRPALRAAIAALALLAVTACTHERRTALPSPSPSPSPSVPATPSPSPSVTPSPTPTGCPTTYAAPDPHRPEVRLAVMVAADHASVRGHETVTFAPDLPTDRLVFRLWANAPTPRRGGGHTEVTAVRVEGRRARFTLDASRTIVTVDLDRTAQPGIPVRADLDYSLTLPSGVNERLGHRGGTAWFGSGFPLLAWERGRGWATEPPSSAFAEATTSEEFELDLTVTAPAGDVVLGTGTPVSDTGGVHRRTAAAVRDVLVAVGPFTVVRARAGPTPVTVGVAPGMPDSAARLAPLHVAAIRAHEARYGPFPYASLDVAVVPDVHGGIEYPGGILLGSRQERDATLVHEVAHEWFYGLVGDDQARDPWLDEAFATYAEALVRGTSGRYLATTIPASGRNRVGAPMTYWESRTSVYYRSVYVQGAVALLRARTRAGPAAFDRAIRCYVAANAHRIARPRDLATALRGLPAALATLRSVGALPPE